MFSPIIKQVPFSLVNCGLNEKPSFVKIQWNDLNLLQEDSEKFLCSSL